MNDPAALPDVFVTYSYDVARFVEPVSYTHLYSLP